ncbi:MAG: TylF/MycF/NovP-related O-methyltransferase [Pseudanabaenaceae cyanobacterium bins.68]|nr:TylF/MycF/NovP-related O-methyltransferase [Pseudanabaenaceae cyanobacterium bins.68]
MRNIINKYLRKFGIKLLNSSNITDIGNFPEDIDSDARAILTKVRNYTMTSIERQIALIDATRYIVKNNISGDFVECGVWKGGSMMAVAYCLQSLGELDRNLYLYDTFEGMTEPSDKDVSHSNVKASVLLSKSLKADQSSIWCYSSLDEVKSNIQSTGYDPSKVFLIKGKIEETIPKYIPQKVALLRLDTDWYESTLHELRHLFPLLVSGGVLIIDDYGHWQGCRQAVDEYIAENKIKIFLNRIDYTGRIGIALHTT